MRRSFFLAALVILLCSPLAARGEAGGAPLSAGELAVRLAVQLEVGEGAIPPSEARKALARAGVEIEGDLDRSIREEDLVAVLNQLGLRLATSQPDRTVQTGQVDRLLDLLLPAPEGKGGQSASDRGNSPPGGGFGRSKSKASPNN